MDRFGFEWERFGRTDPYYGVIPRADFRGRDIGADARERFFAEGEHDIGSTLALARKLFGIAIPIDRVLDFGCGVGRTTIPLARSAREITGVDVSESMLGEATRNCERAGVLNARFLLSRPGLEGIEGPFDFIHSFIVFQHIPPSQGIDVIARLLALLAPSAVAALHVTFGRDASALRRAASWARRTIPGLHATFNVIGGRPAREPMMAMFEYDLPQVLALIERAGYPPPFGVFTNHGGYAGVMLFIGRDRSADDRRHDCGG